MSDRRTFDTAIRSQWNAPIHHCLKAIDAHTSLFLATGLPWHSQKAELLRQYIGELKTWIHEEERKCLEDVGFSPRS
jgi:hypothetical protein